jgi:hypothetical protein
MSMKQVSLRLDAVEHDSLRLRASLERRPMNDIITDAIREYSRSHPIPREDMLAMVRAIAKEDASLLKALEDA